MIPLLFYLLFVKEEIFAAPADQPLLTQSSLTYVGAFRLPLGSSDQTTFAWGGTSMAFNPAKNSLYIVGHDWYQRTAEVSIPSQLGTGSLSSLPTATFLQQFSDSLEGKMNQINPSDPNSKKIGSQLVYNNKLYIGAWSYYDGAGTQNVSQFVRPLSLSPSGQVTGPVKVGATYPGWVDMYAGTIPPEWQSIFGGPALTGGCCASIISAQSLGPSVSVFNPADVGSKNPVPATLLVGYPYSNPTLGTWEGNGSPNPIYNMATFIKGVVFPQGSRSVLFFGSTGLGTPCYGTGAQCNDLDGSSKGTHSYPYTGYVWAYDANDLLMVKNGQKKSWEIRPYSTWQLNLPFSGGQERVGGAVYDPANQLIYVLGEHGDGDSPVVQVYKLSLALGTNPTPTPTPTPPIPATLKGDLNNDRIVNSLDWSIMNSKWFTSDATSDLNADGIVNSLDFSIMNGNWLKNG